MDLRGSWRSSHLKIRPTKKSNRNFFLSYPSQSGDFALLLERANDIPRP